MPQDRRNKINTHTTFNRVRYGTVTVGTNCTQLQAASLECFEVLLVASPNNQQGTIIYVGEMADGCHIPLSAGSSCIVPINDLNKVYVRASAGTQTVHWAAGTW